MPSSIRVSSPAFADGGTIPKRFTCDGDEVSPPLRWSGVPADAQELALIVNDPDAPGGSFVHWVLYNLAPSHRGLAAGEVPAEALEAENSAGKRAYAGPCPPQGDEPHHYEFTLYALRSQLSQSDDADTNAVRAAVADAAMARGQLVGRFGR